MDEIRIVNKEEIDRMHFKPEPHTVDLKDHGDWYGFFVDDRLVAVACVRIQRNSLYFGSLFTDQKFRHMGIMTKLVAYIMDTVPWHSYTAHCLAASRNIFLKLGFTETNVRYFPGGTQYWMKKEA